MSKLLHGSPQTLWFLLAHGGKMIGSNSPLAYFVGNVCSV